MLGQLAGIPLSILGPRGQKSFFTSLFFILGVFVLLNFCKGFNMFYSLPSFILSSFPSKSKPKIFFLSTTDLYYRRYSHVAIAYAACDHL